MRTVKMPCGCVHELERERWTHLCPTHLQEFAETHDRWAREHQERREVRDETLLSPGMHKTSVAKGGAGPL